MVLRDGPVLICDEPAAPLDTEAERAVYQSLRRLADGRTLLLISHRLTSVRRADQILVPHRGRIVERGRHEEPPPVGATDGCTPVDPQLTESGLTRATH